MRTASGRAMRCRCNVGPVSTFEAPLEHAAGGTDARLVLIEALRGAVAAHAHVHAERAAPAVRAIEQDQIEVAAAGARGLEAERDLVGDRAATRCNASAASPAPTRRPAATVPRAPPRCGQRTRPRHHSSWMQCARPPIARAQRRLETPAHRSERQRRERPCRGGERCVEVRGRASGGGPGSAPSRHVAAGSGTRALTRADTSHTAPETATAAGTMSTACPSELRSDK